MKFQLRMGDLLRLIFGLFVTLTIHICSAQGGVANRETLAAGGSFGTPPPPTGTSEKSSSSAEDEQFWLEVKAIIGGVLGFWGGVGSLGTIFLVMVLSQRYCCRKDDDKDDADG